LLGLFSRWNVKLAEGDVGEFLRFTPYFVGLVVAVLFFLFALFA
jgi:hypothetical protein